jgi:hypothetical protein
VSIATTWLGPHRTGGGGGASSAPSTCKPTVSYLRVFSCLTFGKELGHIGKLNDRSSLGVFIGYAEGSKAYRILDPGTQRVRMMRDVVFNDGR